MNGLKFKLYGSSAIFTVPDTNLKGNHISYSHIHKVALMGLLGSVTGLSGYNIQQITGTDYPEFYANLSKIKVSIVPSKPIFDSKIHGFTNTSGFSNKDGTEIVNEQILEDVSWDIYLIQSEVKNEIWDRLKHNLINGIQKYHIYLGRKSHIANIKNIDTCNFEDIKDIDEVENIDSLFPYDMIEDLEEPSEVEGYMLRETFPISLTKENNLYEYERFIFTNYDLEVNNTNNLYRCYNKVLYFI